MTRIGFIFEFLAGGTELKRGGGGGNGPKMSPPGYGPGGGEYCSKAQPLLHQSKVWGSESGKARIDRGRESPDFLRRKPNRGRSPKKNRRAVWRGGSPSNFWNFKLQIVQTGVYS